MSAMYLEIDGGKKLPLDPRFVLMAGVDGDGIPVPFTAGALPAGAATEAKQDDLIERSFGLRGAEVIGDTSEHEGEWCAFTVLSDATISAITSSDITGTLTGFAIPAGVTIYGTITKVTLTSGTVIAYNK